jgi:hypothetical protein
MIACFPPKFKNLFTEERYYAAPILPVTNPGGEKRSYFFGFRFLGLNPQKCVEDKQFMSRGKAPCTNRKRNTWGEKKNQLGEKKQSTGKTTRENNS